MESPASGERSPDRDLERLHDDLQAEYARLTDIVSAFDQRLLTIKGWGVTLSLASVRVGFQQDHYGLFLVAAAGGLAFWLVDATTKMHQIRYYPRMGDIECISYELSRWRRRTARPPPRSSTGAGTPPGPASAGGPARATHAS
jgi:hypothetical protein